MTQTSNPLVTVIVPAYRHERFVRQAIESVFTQTYQHLELIVVDDNSPDSTLSIIRDCEKHAPFPMTVIARTKNCGVTKNLNEGLALAKGEFFGGVASDDAWHPDKVKRQVEAFEPDVVALLSDMVLIDESGKVIGSQCTTHARHGDGEQPLSTVSFLDFGLGYASPSAQSGLFRTQTLRDIGGWSTQFHTEDLDLMLRVAARGTVKCVHAPLTIYRSVETGQNRKWADPKLKDEQERLLGQHRERFEALGVSWDQVMARTWFRRANFYDNVGEQRLAVSSAVRSLMLQPLKVDTLKLMARVALPKPVRSVVRRLRGAVR